MKKLADAPLRYFFQSSPYFSSHFSKSRPHRWMRTLMENRQNQNRQPHKDRMGTNVMNHMG